MTSLPQGSESQDTAKGTDLRAVWGKESVGPPRVWERERDLQGDFQFLGTGHVAAFGHSRGRVGKQEAHPVVALARKMDVFPGGPLSWRWCSAVLLDGSGNIKEKFMAKRVQGFSSDGSSRAHHAEDCAGLGHEGELDVVPSS